jgi:hypothetical protein
MFSEYIEQSSTTWINRGRNNNKNRNISKQKNRLSSIAFWGVTITVGGLAIYLWNHSQSIDPTKLINSGDFLAQLYR